MTELERIEVQLKAIGYRRGEIASRLFIGTALGDWTCLWVPQRLWTPEMRVQAGSDEWYHPTLWLADNDLTGDELRAGKGMYFEDPIVAAVWLKTEASVKP